jgi:hypothetical protein
MVFPSCKMRIGLKRSAFKANGEQTQGFVRLYACLCVRAQWNIKALKGVCIGFFNGSVQR